jgi:hypothetical protein
MKFKIIGKGEMKLPVLLRVNLMLINQKILKNGRKRLNFPRML